ncbi:hypothetical protein OAU50_05750 [Planctomycetota bacterium]|nr:hypothetical protein [Planctomycetota bacterium]
MKIPKWIRASDLAIMLVIVSSFAAVLWYVYTTADDDTHSSDKLDNSVALIRE